MRIISDATGLTISTPEGDLVILSAEDVAFTSVKNYALDGGRDIATIRELISDAKDEVLALATDAENAVDGEDGGEYRIAHGDPVSDVVFRTAVRAGKEGKSSAVSAFLARLKKNPSSASRSQLFTWLKSEGFTLTTNGLIIGYKGVSSEFKSISSGKEPVTVTQADGTAAVHTGTIPYPIGATVTIPRELVDDNRDASCSVGLHVGTFRYASTFGERTLLVLVDPADVVSVPRHSGGDKMRVSKFVVAAEHNGSKVQEAVITISDPSKRRPKRDDSRGKRSTSSSHRGHRKHRGGGRSDSRKPRRINTLALDGVTAEVAESILAKVSESPLSNRELGKRFSKARRTHVPAALEHLLSTKRIVLGEDKKYAPA